MSMELLLGILITAAWCVLIGIELTIYIVERERKFDGLDWLLLLVSWVGITILLITGTTIANILPMVGMTAFYTLMLFLYVFEP